MALRKLLEMSSFHHAKKEWKGIPNSILSTVERPLSAALWWILHSKQQSFVSPAAEMVLIITHLKGYDFFWAKQEIMPGYLKHNLQQKGPCKSFKLDFLMKAFLLDLKQLSEVPPRLPSLVSKIRSVLNIYI